MESPAHEKNEPDMEKIYVDLEQLKTRINQFIITVEGENAEEDRQKIKTLTAKTKRMLTQHKEVKKELLHYENEYRKALLKNARILKKTLKRDKRKLDELKEKCRSEGVQVKVAMLKRNHKEPKGPMEEQTDETFFKGKYPTIKDKIKIKMRTRAKPAGRNIFKQKNPRRSDNIKIQIQKNKETGERELFFFSKAKERFSNLVQQKEVKSDKFRECRIMLQKLTEEQAKKYTDKKGPEPRKDPRKSQGSSPKNVKRRSSGVKPNWQIRIPRDVLEESQSEPQETNPNTADTATTTKRTRSTE